MFIFDGDNRTITIDGAYVVDGVVQFSVQEMWSRWVDWNAATSGIYPRAFDIVMVPLSPTEYVGPYLFMRNDLGWRVMPPAINPCTIIIEGSFYGKDPMLPVMVNLDAQATDMIVNRSSITNTITTEGGSGTGPTANEIAAATRALFVSNPAFRQAMTEDVWGYQR